VIRMEIRLLGPVEVHAVGHRVDAGPPQRRAMLAALAVDVGRPVAVETLIDRVWDKAPARVSGAVHALISQLRRVLDEANASEPADARGRLMYQSGGYVLEVDPQQVDLYRFRRLVAAASNRQRPTADRAGLLREALDLWRGRALVDLPGDWPARMRDTLNTERLDAAVKWARAEVNLGHHDQIIGPVRALTVDYPHVEGLVAVLMRALAGAGRAPEALDCYTLTRARMVEELGTTPSPELQDLQRSILRGDPVVVSPPRALTPEAVPGVPAQLPLDVHGFTGRDDELARLDTLLGEAAKEITAVVISAIGGTAGVGKTALAIHWAHRVRAAFPDGQLYVNLRGFDPTGTMMAPTEAIHGFLDVFAVPPERIPAELGTQAALYRSLLADKRVLIVLDNARDTDQVRPLLPGSPNCFVVVTSRNQLTGLVAKEGAHPVNLNVLCVEEAWQLLARRLGINRMPPIPKADDQVATVEETQAVEEIIACCAGLPLALAIVTARAATRPHLPLTALAAELRDARTRLDVLADADPSTDVRAVFSWSYTALTPLAAQLFRLLGQHPGPDISAPAAASLAGFSLTHVRPLLAELLRAQLTIETAAGRYAFHDLLRAYAIEQGETIDNQNDRQAANRRLLDHYIHTGYAAARLLMPTRLPIALAPPHPRVMPGNLSDDQEALAWFSAEHRVLLAIVNQAAADGFHADAWRLTWTLADFFDRRGHWKDWAATGEAALAAAKRMDDSSAQAICHSSLGRPYIRLGRLDEAYHHYQRALTLYEEVGEIAGQAAAHRGLGMVCWSQGNLSEALSHAQHALDLFRNARVPAQEARALNAVGWYLALLGRHEDALASCHQALKLQQQLGDYNGQASTWDSLGYAHHHLGHHAAAIECYKQALNLYRHFDSRYGQAEILMHLGDTHHTAGNSTAARVAWQQALIILEDLKHPDADKLRDKLCL
jgi:DNA-binding SARP family transcriptional activator/tetratricopeptide (TPR) repeat protein